MEKTVPDLSICVTLKNRSLFYVPDVEENITSATREYIKCPNHKKVPEKTPNGEICLRHFQNFLASLVALKLPHHLELVVSDWNSTDVNVEELVAEKLKDSLICWKVVQIPDVVFSRGRGRNVAMRAASSDRVLFLDADMILLSGEIIEKTLKAIAQDAIYFPICFCFRTAKHEEGWWEQFGYGLVGVHKKNIRENWKEFTQWGLEDDDFFHQCESSGKKIIRERCSGLFHQWHPESPSFKNKYAKLS